MKIIAYLMAVQRVLSDQKDMKVVANVYMFVYMWKTPITKDTGQSPVHHLLDYRKKIHFFRSKHMLFSNLNA